MKKLILFLLITLILINGCSDINSTYKEYRNYQEQAKKVCNDRDGELIHFGLIVNPVNQEQHYESVCYKEDERVFYYDLIA